MSQVPVWFDRKFDFSFPVEMHPNLCARLRGTPARLEDALRDRAGKTLIAKPQQKWSAQEHAGHLLELEPLWLARVEDYIQGNEQLATTDLQNRKTDDANYNSQPLEQVLGQFRAARKTLLKRLEGLGAGLFSRPIPHPRLKVPMRLVAAICFLSPNTTIIIWRKSGNW